MTVTKRWQLAPAAASVLENNRYSLVLRQLLALRGIDTPAALEAFLLADLPRADYLKQFDPFLFSDMEKAVALIINHIKAGDLITIYGDYDADGVTSTAALWEILTLFKARVDAYLPDRVSEGYGMNKGAIEKIAANGSRLIITVDNGTRSYEEVLYAQNLGLDIIITDHHALPDDEKLIPSCLFINCTDKRQDYPTRNLAGVGVAFKLVQALLAKSKLDEETKKQLEDKVLDLVAMGTVSDMMPLLGENRILVKKGLLEINKFKRLGVRELIKVIKSKAEKIDAWGLGFQIGPRLNAASRLGNASNALSVLLTKDEAEASLLAQELNQKNISRQEITEKIMGEVEAQIDKENVPDIIIGVSSIFEEGWNEGVIGLVAGKICEKYYRPALIITSTADGFKGSGRSIEEFNLISAIEEAKENLDKYGGHPGAAGFSIYSQEKLDGFTAAMKKIAAVKLQGLELSPKLGIDLELKLSEIDLDLAREVELLSPFGQGNPQPKFVTYGATINDIVNMGGDNQHIKIRLGSIWAIAFFKSEAYSHLQIGDTVDLVYYLDINGYNGRSEVQLRIIDLKKTNL
ncbi:MAG TPA: single-stranded-DNA-specific exonuclease RecJ [bacterium]|nr:single-stranded-DNA-specific exonuclease RecJ [bacterium]HPT29749.1 single-stranded-DNA-specific exonuclease RecJ [bacterium]